MHILTITVGHGRVITNVELIDSAVAAALSSHSTGRAGSLDREGALLPLLFVLGASVAILLAQVRLHEVTVVVDGSIDLGDIVDSLTELTCQAHVVRRYPLGNAKLVSADTTSSDDLVVAV